MITVQWGYENLTVQFSNGQKWVGYQKVQFSNGIQKLNENVRFLNVSGFQMVGFRIATVLTKNPFSEPETVRTRRGGVSHGHPRIRSGTGHPAVDSATSPSGNFPWIVQ